MNITCVSRGTVWRFAEKLGRDFAGKTYCRVTRRHWRLKPDRVLLRYAHTLSLQTAGTALSNAVHTVDERLARWILMCDDRTDGNSIALTHEFLAIMLAVRRASVTTALHVLEGNRLIEARRGVIVVRDRDALEEFAGDAYGYPEAEYRRLIGSFHPVLATVE